VPSGATTTSATVEFNSRLTTLQFTQSQSRCQKAHRTVNSTCPMHHRTVRWPHMLELQWSNPNGWVTWLAHQTVSAGAPDCPMRPSTAAPPNGHFGGWGNKYPQPPHFKASKFSANTFNTRSLYFTPRHKSKDQILSKSQTHSKDLVACERDLCSFEFLSLGSLVFFPILVSKTFVIKARDTNCVVVLVGTKCPN
jgi:hypothetical protein